MQKACHLLCYVTTVPACGYMMADSFHEGLRPHINGVISLQRAVQAVDQVFAAGSLVINLECKKTGAGSTWRAYGTVCLSRYGVWASVHIAWMTWSRGLESKLMPVLRIWHRLSHGGLASWQLLTTLSAKQLQLTSFWPLSLEGMVCLPWESDGFLNVILKSICNIIYEYKECIIGKNGAGMKCLWTQMSKSSSLFYRVRCRSFVHLTWQE